MSGARTLNVVAVVVGMVVVACAARPAATTTTTPATSSTTVGTTTTTVQGTSSTTATTTTAEEKPGQLLVVGDYGNGKQHEQAVADAMRAWADTHPVAALLTVGDNLYTGRTDRAWTEPYGWLADKGIPVWVTWGNHDHDRSGTVRDTYGDPPPWTTHRWGDVTVVILDSEQVRSDDQDRWMRRTLAGVGGPVVVAEHHPPWSCSAHGDNRRVQERWVPVWEDATVALVLSGHEHNYQHFHVDGIHYVVTGGGGAGLYKLKDCPGGHPPRLGGAATYQFLALTQTDGGVTVEVVGSDGAIVDRFEVPWR